MATCQCLGSEAFAYFCLSTAGLFGGFSPLRVAWQGLTHAGAKERLKVLVLHAAQLLNAPQNNPFAKDPILQL